MRAVAALFLAVTLTACVPPTVIRTSDGRPATTDVAAARKEANVARARLDSALRDGDVTRVLGLLDERLVVVLEDGDSLVGRGALAARLSLRYDDVRAAAIHMFPGAVVLCVDGMVETASDITIFVGHAQRADTIATIVSAHWRNAGPGAWRLARLEMGRALATRAPSRANCPRVDSVRFAASRFRISATMPYTMQNTPQRASLENQFRLEGYVAGSGPARTGPSVSSPVTHTTDGSVGPIEGFISVRTRLTGPWWFDAALGYGSASLTVHSYNVVSGSRVRMDSEVSQSVSALLQYERAPWRLGLGAGAANVRWDSVDDRNDFLGGSGVPVVTGSSSGSAVGGLAEVAYTLPLAGPLFLEARLRQRFAMNAVLPAFGSIQGGGRVSLNATAITVGFGLAY